jgi:hypothetical protein
MKLEYLSDGSPECLLIRLYKFNRSEAQQLRQLVKSLVTGDGKDAHVRKVDSGCIVVSGLAERSVSSSARALYCAHSQ